LVPRSEPSVFSDPQDSTRRKTRDRRRALGRRLRQGALVLGLVAAAVGTVLALRPRPVPVDIATVIRGPLVVAIEETGKTRVKDRYVVSAPATGRVSRLALEPGDVVREGDTLAEISPTLSPLLDQRTRAETEARLGAALSALGQSKAQVARALTAKEQAERELERAVKLAASGSLPAEAREQAEFALRLRSDELTSAEFGVKVAGEEARLARAALARPGKDPAQGGHLDVLAPASGRVLSVHQKSAGVVQAGAPLLEVADPSQLEGVVDLLTTDAVRVRPGTPVEIIGWGGDRRLPGRVRELEPSAFTRPSALGVDEQRVNVIVAFGEPKEQWQALGVGYHIEVRLILWASDAVTQVPLGAVFRQGSGWACYVLDNGVARLRSIEVGHRGETSVETTSGLELGDAVIVHPGDRVQDGVRVEVHAG
jgi:HlyD family secretion protein